MGLDRLAKNYEEKPGAATAFELGIGHLYLEKYEEAYVHLKQYLVGSRRKGDAFYGMMGVSKACLNSPKEAVKWWLAGLNANYSRSSGFNVRMRLLLYVASRLNVGEFDQDSSAHLLREIEADQRIRVWPGPIVTFLLGTSAGSRSEAEIDFSSASALTRHWLFRFYRTLHRRELLVAGEFMKEMKLLVDLVNYCEDESQFLSYVWAEEFYLARYIVERSAQS